MVDLRLGLASAAAAALAYYWWRRGKQQVCELPAVPGEGHITTNDGLHLHYIVRGRRAAGVPPVVLVHGWSGSSAYFSNSIDLIAAQTGGCVYALDLRFHGRSDKPSWGFHVHRLAADLHDMLTELRLEQPVVVGSSLGCAIIWAFVELYGDESLGKLVFIDQAPSQWRFPDWTYGSKGIFDEASLARIQQALHSSMETFAAGNAECCLSHPLAAPLDALLARETLLCDPDHLARLMADHAPRDWRPVLRRITRPCLNLYGTQSGCFPVEGLRAVGELIADCRSIAFEGHNHWLYLEAPAKFAQLLGAFATDSQLMGEDV